MDRWVDKSNRNLQNQNQNQNPSFSSTLLDAIYRSIDEEGNCEEDQLIFYRETMRKKHGGEGGGNNKEDREKMSLHRACMIEKWMETKVSTTEKKVTNVGRRKSMADFDNRNSRRDRDSVLLNSSSSSSDSSCGGGFFSSSDAESVMYGVTKSASVPNIMQRPKPIRTSVSARPEKFEKARHDNYHHERPKNEALNGFSKTKSRALKIYGDLKKVKQPISPGGRLASFLNSLFTTKKVKISSSSSVGSCYDEKTKYSMNTSTCSSATSFSRSCLSKTPSSRGKLSSTTGTKRSVRFYPVSVILDEDCRPHKSLCQDEIPSFKTVKSQDLKVLHVLKENQNGRVEVNNIRDLLKNYRKNEDDFVMKDLHDVEDNSDEDEDEDDDEEDAASCSSSDLFELDNLSAIGNIDKYCEELPVYETTHLGTNRAIANGLIM